MPDTFKCALVTGGAGFVGSHLCHALLKRGMRVTAIDDLSMGTVDRIADGVRFIHGDVRNQAHLSEALAGVDIVFHQAAKVRIRASVENALGDADVNIMGTLALLQAMAHAGSVRRMIVASSMAIYGDSASPVPMPETFAKAPLSPYGTGKLAAETFAVQLGGAHGIDVVPLRYFNIYGPGQGLTPYVGVVTIFINALLKGEAPTIFGDGEQTRDFVHVRDVIAANIAAMERGVHGRSYNIGSGRGLSVNDVARILIGKIAPNVKAKTGPLHHVETRNSVADISLSHRELGYRPSGVFERDIDEIIEAVRSPAREPAE